MAEWRDVVGHEGKYQVSSDGEIRSLIRGGILRPAIRRTTGHQHVMLAQPRRTALVHALVAEAFRGPRPEGAEVRHLNGDPSDNRVVNLQYGTRSQNARDSKAHGTHFHAGLTHCKRGHELSGDNLQDTVTGHRICLACRRERSELYAAGSRVVPEGQCPNGHLTTPENRYTNGTGRSRCKPCTIAYRQRLKERRCA